MHSELSQPHSKQQCPHSSSRVSTSPPPPPTHTRRRGALAGCCAMRCIAHVANQSRPWSLTVTWQQDATVAIRLLASLPCMLPACAREWSTEHAEAQMAAISDLHCRIVWCSTNPGRNQKHAVSHGQSSMLEVQSAYDRLIKTLAQPNQLSLGDATCNFVGSTSLCPAISATGRANSLHNPVLTSTPTKQMLWPHWTLQQRRRQKQ
jgi:hypothetical protein